EPRIERRLEQVRTELNVSAQDADHHGVAVPVDRQVESRGEARSRSPRRPHPRAEGRAGETVTHVFFGAGAGVVPREIGAGGARITGVPLRSGALVHVVAHPAFALEARVTEALRTCCGHRAEAVLRTDDPLAGERRVLLAATAGVEEDQGDEHRTERAPGAGHHAATSSPRTRTVSPRSTHFTTSWKRAWCSASNGSGVSWTCSQKLSSSSRLCASANSGRGASCGAWSGATRSAGRAASR